MPSDSAASARVAPAGPASIAHKRSSTTRGKQRRMIRPSQSKIRRGASAAIRPIAHLVPPYRPVRAWDFVRILTVVPALPKFLRPASIATTRHAIPRAGDRPNHKNARISRSAIQTALDIYRSVAKNTHELIVLPRFRQVLLAVAALGKNGCQELALASGGIIKCRSKSQGPPHRPQDLSWARGYSLEPPWPKGRRIFPSARSQVRRTHVHD
jgi:hypothetical protein